MPLTDTMALRVLLIALTAFGPLATDLYLPALPGLVTEFHTDIATTQLTLSVYMVGFAAAQLAYGPVSDRFGRRPTLLAGVSLFAVASALCLFAHSIEALIVGRFLQALGACCGPVVGRAVVRDVFGREKAATIFAYLGAAMALAPAIAPMIGGGMTEAFGWQAPFVFLCAFGVAIVVWVAVALGESNRMPDEDALSPVRLIRNYVTLLGDRTFVGNTLVATFTFAGLFAFISGSSFILIDTMHISPTVYGICFGVVALGMMAGSLLAGRLSARLGTRAMLRLGATCGLIGGLTGGAFAAAGVMHLAVILPPMVLFTIGQGMTMPNAMAGAVTPFPRMAGLASALLGFIQMTVASAMGILVGHLADGTSLPMMGMIAVAGVAAFAAYLGVLPRHGIRPEITK